ncbi:NAD(P)/FAD-dependent oxidoreductase [Bacillus rubiinfantis]|uniref:NAD(P)/FAD-dependent oxidoreductase n=1 Tax=Bacillus rubiinfantis TaxID=1499680 RepID=UPI0005A608AB|nr:NAD(P)/FAD-dependent oxidoreductase [Bacillus rubiinfantis]
MEQQELFDVTIIGGGPAGLYSAFYSGLRNMKTKLIEFQSELGGKLHIYPEKMIWDVGGIPPIPAAQLRRQLVEQGLTFAPTVVLNEKVEAISQNEEGIFALRTSSGHTHLSKTVIVAIGSGILKPKRLEIAGAERFEGVNLHYSVKSLAQFKDKTVLISGGGNTAIDWANELESIAKTVYVVYRKDRLKGHEAQAAQLLNSSAVCLFHTSITRLIDSPNGQKIARVELTNHETAEVSNLPVDEVIINHGYETDASLLKNSDSNIAMVDDYYLAGNAQSESSVGGLYGAGDILMYDGKVQLIAGAFQDAANAVNKAKQWIEPAASKTAMVSSHNDRFKQRNRELVKQMLKNR